MSRHSQDTRRAIADRDRSRARLRMVTATAAAVSVIGRNRRTVALTVSTFRPLGPLSILGRPVNGADFRLMRLRAA